MDDLERILIAARKHGHESHPDMEVEDLQQLARDLWRVLTPELRKHFVGYSRMGTSFVNWHVFLEQWG